MADSVMVRRVRGVDENLHTFRAWTSGRDGSRAVTSATLKFKLAPLVRVRASSRAGAWAVSQLSLAEFQRINTRHHITP